MIKIIGYARVSTTKQDLSRQKLKIKEFCENNNYELIEIIEDFGISGVVADRKGYIELQSKTYKDADMIVISELSRLSRQEDVTETVYNIQQIINKGLSVILLDSPSKIYEANKLLDITEILILTIKAWAAAQERLDIKKKNQDGKQALFQAYPYAVVDQKIPYGYKAVPNPNGKRPKYILEEVPEEVENIKRLFALVNSGKTLGAVARYFNERNITFRGYYSTVAILSNYIHSDIYRGIRRRTQRLGREEPYTIEVRIKPIISEEDFMKAQELIKNNYKNTPTGKVNHNPLKGIIRCRCGRAMTVKDKKPAAGISKLTYRCSCVDRKSHPDFCKYNIDEVSYDLTNEILYSLFKSMHTAEYINFFRNQTDNRVTELQEEIAGIEKRLSTLYLDKENLSNESQENANKFLLTTNPTLLNIIQEKQNQLDEKIKSIDKEIIRYKKSQSKKIADIERIKDNNGKEKLQNLSIEEQGELYHKYLERVNYIPVTTMQGYYIVQFLNGIKFYIAITKVRSIAMASLLLDNWTIDEKGIITANYDTLKSSDMKNFSIEMIRKTKTMTLQEYLKTDLAKERALHLDLSYRERYLEELHKAGLDGRLRPLKKGITSSFLIIFASKPYKQRYETN